MASDVSATRPPRARRRRWRCIGCSTRRVRRRWSYCKVCLARLERNEQLDQEYPGRDFLVAIGGPVAPAAPRLVRRLQPLLSPTDPVRCDRYECALPLKTCLQRQDARWPGAGRNAAIYRFCGSGRCRQGAEYRRRTDYVPAEDWARRSKSRSPRYQSFRPDAGIQRRKRRLELLSQPEGEVPTIDRPPGLGSGCSREAREVSDGQVHQAFDTWISEG